MSAIICLPVDFETNSLGLPSLLAEEIDGASVLYHTVSRLTLAPGCRAVLLFQESPRSADDVERAREMLGGLDFEIHVSAAADVPNRDFLRRARLFGLDSWRGGLGWTTYYDEDGAPAALAEAAERFNAETVGLITADSPYVDPNLTGEMLAWHQDKFHTARLTVTGVPPGMAPAFFNIDVLRSYATQNLTLATTIAYNPTRPQRDLATTEAHFEADMRLRLCPRRFTAHSARQIELFRGLCALGCSPRGASALRAVETYAAHPELWPGAVPAKVEIEPTSRFAVAPFYLREFLASRTPADMPLERFAKIVESIRPAQDVVLSLEGLGDALLNGEIAAMVAAAKEAGLLGVHIATSGLPLDAALREALTDAELDVLSVALGAASEEGYRRLYSANGLDQAAAALIGVIEARKASGVPRPLAVAEMTKLRALEGDVEPFYNRWIAESDWPLIRPCNDFAGQVEDASTIHMRTSLRGPCRRIFTELYVDAEGIALPCRQDIHRTAPLGDAAEMGVGALWHSQFMENLRAAHLAGDYDFFPLCRNCKDSYYTM